MKELKLNYEQAKELRNILGQAIGEMDALDNEKKFEIISNLFDQVLDIENELE